MSSVASACVCLSVCNVLTFESLDVESSFLVVCRYVVREYICRVRNFVSPRSLVQDKDTEAENALCLQCLFVGGPPATERQSCLNCGQFACLTSY